MPNDIMLCITELKQQGWTQSLITRFLGNPDQLKPNPHYRKAVPMKLYHAERVKTVTDKPEWQEALNKTKAKKESSAKAVETKTAALLEHVRSIRIKVLVRPMGEITQLACRHYNDRALGRDDWDGTTASAKDSPEFLARITVNYLRHTQSCYETELDRAFGKTGVRMAYRILKSRVLGAIAAAYPNLSKECDRQFEEVMQEEVL